MTDVMISRRDFMTAVMISRLVPNLRLKYFRRTDGTSVHRSPESDREGLFGRGASRSYGRPYASGLRRALAGRSPVNARSYLTDVPSIRSQRRDRRYESTFDRGDDEPAVTEEFLTPKPNIDARKVDVRPNS